MAKFNTHNTRKTVNESGHVAYSMADKEKLVTQVLTTFFNEAKYYGDNSKEIIAQLRKVCKAEPEFVAKLGLFARYDFNMRSISHVVAAVLANVEQGKPYARKYISQVCRRADDMTEILSCYITLYGKPIPNALKKGLADALPKFDEYALAKYDRDGSVKLRDIIQLAHPSPKTRTQARLWKCVLERSLLVPETWETQLSANGNTKEVWERLIENDALGYMAMLRNLRNILDASPRNINKVYRTLADQERVEKSRVLPFRFYSAYQELRKHPTATSKTMDALEDAIKASTANIPNIPGKTLLAVDVSGSMDYPVSNKSKATCRDIACLIGSMANCICEDAIITTFDTRIRKHTFSHRAGILETAESMKANGGGTNIHLPFEYLLENNLKVDRVIMLSDNEINYGHGAVVQQTADKCRRALNKDMWVHAIDLQGYGTQQFIGARTNIIAGWSEKTLEFITLAERGVGSLISKIESKYS